MIRLPPDAAFSCGKCNDCCKRGWLIGLSQVEVDRLRTLYPDFEATREVEVEPGKRMFGMSRKEDGSCVFLDPDGCRIHKEHGFAAKPDICRRFPFFLWNDGETVRGHLSRMCPTVYAVRGARSTQLLREIEPLVPGALQAPPRPSEVAMAGARSVSRAEYERFEDLLVALLLDVRWPLDDAVHAGCLLIRQQLEVAARTREDKSDHDLAMELVMSAIAKRSLMPALHRYVIAAMTTVIESRRDLGISPGIWLDDSARFFRLLLRRGRVRLRAIDAECDLSRISEVPWPRRDRPDLAPVRSLLASHIRRGILLEAPDVEFGYHMLIAAYAALKFYARASAAAAERELLIPEDLRRGVMAVEYNLLLHRKFIGAPLERKFVGSAFRKFLFHESFPSSMVGL